MTGGEMLVALPRATRNGETFFGHHCNLSDGEEMELLRMPGRGFSPGESVRIGNLLLPQVRRTATVLAGRCPGQWGYRHGLNEHGVSIGLTTIATKKSEPERGLIGSDLVRLALERGISARQAVDVLTDLAGRHGQSAEDGEHNPAFLIADGCEAFVLEMFGRHWAAQHVAEVRAVSDVCHLRQDWDRVSPGLASLAIERGWWPADGSKLDFTAAVGREGGDNATSLRRWGQATLLLEQNNGQIDSAAARRILSDCFVAENDSYPAASLLTQVGSAEGLPIAWYNFGPQGWGVYFPLFLVGELPAEWLRMPELLRTPSIRPEQADEWRAARVGLQQRFDRQTREFVAEATELRERGELEYLPRLAELFARHNLESWENLCLEFAPTAESAERVCADSEFHSAGAWS